MLTVAGHDRHAYRRSLGLRRTFIFKVRRLGFWLGISAMIAGLLSLAISWSLWVTAVPQIVSAGRAAQGKNPSEGELQSMQAFCRRKRRITALCADSDSGYLTPLRRCFGLAEPLTRQCA